MIVKYKAKQQVEVAKEIDISFPLYMVKDIHFDLDMEIYLFLVKIGPTSIFKMHITKSYNGSIEYNVEKESFSNLETVLNNKIAYYVEQDYEICSSPTLIDSWKAELVKILFEVKT